jgi:hypothetical protein
MDVDNALIDLAATKYLLVDRSDVASVMTSPQWCRRTDQGQWRQVAPGVWCHRATPVDWQLQARAGLRSLGRRSALYSRTAAAWWELGEIDVVDVEFLVPRNRRSRSFPFPLHTTTRWTSTDTVMHKGLRVTTATRTAIDLAAANPARDVERFIDAAVHRRLTSLPTLQRRLQLMSVTGHPGGEMLRALLLGTGGESYLERRFLELIAKAGLPRPSCQVVHADDGTRIARVDFQFPGTNVIVEVSGRLGHVSDADRRRDARRRNALQQTGHVVLEFTTADVLDDPAYTVAVLARFGVTR